MLQLFGKDILFRALLALAQLAGPVGLAAAQSYPNKPIRLMIPQAPDRGSDTIGRFIVQKLVDSLGQPGVARHSTA